MTSCSHRGLKAGGEQRFASATGKLGFTVEMGEYDFVGEERGPFKGGGAVGIGAAQKLVLSIREFYEFSPTKLLDHLLATALGNQIF